MEYTRKRAWTQADEDVLDYGTGFVQRKWWGFRRLHPFRVLVIRETENTVSFATTRVKPLYKVFMARLGGTANELERGKIYES
jgi:hypothetical protein